MHRKLISFIHKKNTSKVLFAILSLIFIFLNYAYLFVFPTGIHFIRQTDTISFTLYYLKNSNYNFFDLGNLNLDFINGKTACEFPLFYYLYFIIFKCFGIQFSLIRWISLIFSAISIYSLFQSLFLLFKKFFLTLGIVLLIISSSIYRYYSLNFLPDSLALSFTIIGISYFINFYCLKKENALYLSFLFVTIASLLKIYYGIYLALFFSSVFLGFISINRKIVMYFLSCIVVIVGWYCYSIYYNFINHASYYLTTMSPIWKMTSKDIDVTFNVIFNYWYTKYYDPTIFHFFIVLGLIAAIPGIMRLKIKLFLLTGLTITIFYCLIFFKQFKDHDYYFLTIIPMLLLLTIFTLEAIIKRFENKYINIAMSLIIIIIGLFGFSYSSLNLYRRFNNTIDRFSITSYQLRNADTFLDSLKVPINSKFLVIGDNTVNGSLVFLNKFGWVHPDFSRDINKITKNLNVADYLVILRPSFNPIPEIIKSKLKNCNRYIYYNNYIYDLKNYNR